LAGPCHPAKYRADPTRKADAASQRDLVRGRSRRPKLGSDMDPSRSDRNATFALFLLLAAGAVRLACVLTLDIKPVSDYHQYFTMAANAAAGRGLVDAHGNRAFYNPGYPILLAGIFWVTGTSLLAAKVANVALGVMSVWFVYALGNATLGSQRA